MINRKTKNTRRVLSLMQAFGLDLLYQQLGGELGVILTFHRVRPDNSEAFSPNAHLSIRPDFLDTTIRLLKHRGVDIVDLDEACRRMAENKRGNRFAVLTFDDGYQDTLANAVPVLQKHAVPYTVYVATGLIDGTVDIWWEGIEALVRQQDHIMMRDGGKTRQFDCSSVAKKQDSFQKLLTYLTTEVPELQQHDRVREICWLYKIDLDDINRDQIMTWDQVYQLMADPLCTVGAHTVNHQAVARLGDEEARREIDQGATELEEMTGMRPRHFAYPYGYRSAIGERDYQLAKSAGFETAVTTMPGMLFPENFENLMALPRISVNGLYQKRRYLGPLLSGLPTRLSNRGGRLPV